MVEEEPKQKIFNTVHMGHFNETPKKKYFRIEKDKPYSSNESHSKAIFRTKKDYNLLNRKTLREIENQKPYKNNNKFITTTVDDTTISAQSENSFLVKNIIPRKIMITQENKNTQFNFSELNKVLPARMISIPSCRRSSSEELLPELPVLPHYYSHTFSFPPFLNNPPTHVKSFFMPLPQAGIAAPNTGLQRRITSPVMISPAPNAISANDGASNSAAIPPTIRPIPAAILPFPEKWIQSLPKILPRPFIAPIPAYVAPTPAAPPIAATSAPLAT